MSCSITSVFPTAASIFALSGFRGRSVGDPWDGEILISLTKKPRSNPAKLIANLDARFRPVCRAAVLLPAREFGDQVLNFGQPAHIDVKYPGPGIKDAASAWLPEMPIAMDACARAVGDSHVSGTERSDFDRDLDRALATEEGHPTRGRPITSGRYPIRARKRSEFLGGPAQTASAIR